MSINIPIKWLLERTYMAADAMKYTNEVDFSLGDIILPSGSENVPVLVSPAKRSDYGLMTINGLQHTLLLKPLYHNQNLMQSPK